MDHSRRDDAEFDFEGEPARDGVAAGVLRTDRRAICVSGAETCIFGPGRAVVQENVGPPVAIDVPHLHEIVSGAPEQRLERKVAGAVEEGADTRVWIRYRPTLGFGGGILADSWGCLGISIS